MLTPPKRIISVMISLIIVLNTSLIAFAQQEAEGPVQETPTETEQTPEGPVQEPSPEEQLQNLLNDTNQFDAQSTGEEELPAIQNPAAKQEAKEYSLENLEQSFVNVLSGASEFQVPITVPNGVNGLSPSLSLSYSSQMTNTNGPFGYGWEVQMGHIKRVSKHGVDQMYQQPIYQVSLPGISGELIQTSSDASSKTYELRREGAFAKITYDKLNENWTVQSKDGMTYYLGTTNQSRWMNETEEMTYAWYIEKVEDLNGNHIDYEYHLQQNVLYPKAIHYGARGNGSHPFTIQFFPFDDPTQNLNNVLLNRNDYQEFDYKKGFKSTYSALITEIQVLVQGSERMKYELMYTYSNHLGRSDLKSVTITGTNGSEVTTQDVTMSYFTPEDGFAGKMYHRHGFLRKIDFFQGGSVEYDYLPTNRFYTTFNRIANPRPHYPMYAVNELKKTDFTGREDIWTYFYSDGAFFADSVEDRQMSGFGRVTVTDPLDQKTMYYFHQGGGFDGSALGEFSGDNDEAAEGRWALIGQLYRTEQYDASGNLIQRNITKWTNTKLNNDQFFPTPITEISTTFNTAGQERSTATATSYDINTGNMTEQHLSGEVSASNNGDYTDLANDDRKMKMSYALNTTKHLLSFPKRQELFDENGSLVSKQEMEYDNLPLGQVEKGNLTRSSQFFCPLPSTICQLSSSSTKITNQSTYNQYGQVISTTDPNGNSTTITYDSTGIYPATITNPLGHQTTFTYDLLFSQPIQVTDPNGLVAETDLDGLGRPLASRLSDPNSSNSLVTMQSIQYLETSHPHAVKTTTHLDTNQTAEAFAYMDGFGRTLQTKTQADPDGSGVKYVVNNTSYDELGRTTVQTLPIFSTSSAYNLSDASSITTTTTYDVLNRPLSITDANGTTTFSHDNFPTALAALGPQVLSSAVWTQSITDANGNYKILAYDAFQRLSQVIEVTQDNTANYQLHSTYYTYDSRDLITKITDAEGNIRNFFSDSLGRLTQQEDLHDSSDTDFGTYSYSYDDNGNVLTSTSPKGEVISFTYDPLNRPISQGPQGAQGSQYSYTYDSGTNALGRLSSISSQGPQGSHSTQLSHDLRGSLTSETTTINGASFTKTYSYTRFDQPSTITSPDGTAISFSYNAVGQIKRIQSGTNDIISSAEYNPINQVTKMVYGNGFTSSMTYDPQQMYRMTNKLTTKGTVVVNSLLTPGPLKGETLPSDFLSDLFEVSSPFKGLGVPKAHASLRDRIKKRIQSRPSLTPGPLKGETSPSGTQVIENEQLENLFEDTSTEAQGTVNQNNLLEQLMNDKGFSIGVPTVNQQTGKLEMQKSSTSPKSMAVGINGKSEITFLGDSTGNSTEVTGTVSLTATYRNSDTNPPQATGYQVIVNKNGRFLWQDSGYITLTTPLNVDETTPQLDYDLSTLTDTAAFYSIQLRFQLVGGGITPVSDPVNFRLSASQGPQGSQGSQLPPTAQFQPTLEIFEADGLTPVIVAKHDITDTLTPLTLQVGVSASSAVTDMSWELSSVDGTVFASSNSQPSTLNSQPFLSHTPLTSFTGEVNDQVTLTWTPDTELLNGATDPSIHLGGSRLSKTTGATSVWILSITVTDIFNQSTSLDTGIILNDARTRIAPTEDIIQDLHYSYDAVGNITRLEEKANTANKKVTDYSYDSLYRLTEATTSQGPQGLPAGQAGTQSTQFTYSPTGNILTKTTTHSFTDANNQTQSSTTTLTYSYDQPNKTNPHAVTKIESQSTQSPQSTQSSQLFTYDDNGNLTTHSSSSPLGTITKQFTWDPYNRMSTSTITDLFGETTTSTYSYDHSGRRLKKQIERNSAVKTTQYPFSDFEITDTGNTKTSVLGNSMHIGTVEYNGGTREIFFSHTDHLSGGNLITNASGSVEQVLDYKPFGGTRVNEKYGVFDERRKYTGHELDDETGLYYAQARYYDPEIGRFVSQDPLQWRVGELMESFAQNPQAFNFYSYTANNPIILVDPDGERLVIQGDTSYRRSVFNLIRRIDSTASFKRTSNNTFEISSKGGTREGQKLIKMISDHSKKVNIHYQEGTLSANPWPSRRYEKGLPAIEVCNGPKNSDRGIS